MHGWYGGVIGYDCQYSKETKICDLNLVELKSIVIKGTNGEETIPSLREVLTLCHGKIWLNIEVKDDNPLICHYLVLLLEEKGWLDHCVVTSFQPSILLELSSLKRSKGIKTGIIIGGFDEQGNTEGELPTDLDDLLSHNINSICVRKDLVTRELGGFCSWHGIPLVVYYPMKWEETEQDYKRLLAQGVNTFITNHPERIKKFRNTHCE